MELLFLLVLILWLYWRMGPNSLGEAFESFQLLITFILCICLLAVVLTVAYRELLSHLNWL